MTMYAGLLFIEHARDGSFREAFFGGFVAQLGQVLPHRVARFLATQRMVLADERSHLKGDGSRARLVVLIGQDNRHRATTTGGSDVQKRHEWLRSPNKALNGKPALLIETPYGLVTTLSYLDGMRAAA